MICSGGGLKRDRVRLVVKEKIEGGLSSIEYGDPVVRYRGSKVIRISSLLTDKKIDVPLSLAVDVFYTFYLPMPILKDRGDVGKSKSRHYRIIDSILKSSFIHDIRSKTVIDGLMSSIAAGVFITEYQRILEENRSGNASTDKKGYEQEEGEEGENIRRDVEKAIANTARDIDAAKKLRMLIEGEQPGSVTMMAYEEYGPELIRLARNTEVRKILDLLMGIKPWNLTIPERKQRFKHGEITGYELGKDIERLVPSTIVLPEELFYLRLLEGRLLLYQKLLSQGRGPLYVLIDKSGSMDGLKMIWAKAVALSLYMRAIREHREFYFRFFDSIPHPLIHIGKRPRASDALKLVDYIARVKGSGGTDISKAIITSCNDIRKGSVKEVGDIVLITDGVDRVAEQLVRYNLKKANARLITVMVMGENKSLRNLSTRYFSVVKLSQENLLRVVEA
jgi:uncharacterized protein with von Willebrand factor type A (vWA) domain